MSNMTPDQALTRARALFRMLPRAGLTETTFRELGRAVNLGLPWERLSKDLKLSILQLIRDYSGQLTLIEVEEDVTLDADADEGEGEATDEGGTPPTTAPADTVQATVADDVSDFIDDDDAEPVPAQVTTAETSVIEAASEATPETPAEAPTPVRRKGQKDKKPAAEPTATETEESPTPPAA